MRAQNAELEFFLDYIAALRSPVIFGGDLNAPPGSKTIRRITRAARDAWVERHFWGGFTFRTGLPFLRLDYLFSMNGVAAVSAERLNVKISDHFPVIAEFVVYPPAPGESHKATLPLSDR